MKLIEIYKRVRRGIYCYIKAIPMYAYDAMHFYKHSLSYGIDNENKFLGAITLRAHVVEKGITMPNRRYNFGADNLMTLITLCNEYYQKGYNLKRTQFVAALSVIFEYELIHIENNQAIPKNITNAISSLKELFPNVQIERQLVLNKADVFRQKDFKYIAENRHSIRNFCGTIEMAKVLKAINLALTAPSACNRQPIRVHIVENYRVENCLFNKIINLQNGNRGFGKDADKLIIVSANTETYLYPIERHAMYIDGGIFTMNLLYSLQYYNIAACTLNTSLLPKDDKLLKQLLVTDEEFIAIIAIGDCPDIIPIARSNRNTIENIITTHNE